MRKTGLNLLVAVLFSTGLFAETVYLNDSFEDGNRRNQELPNSAAWFFSARGHLELAKVDSGPLAGNHVLRSGIRGGDNVRGALAYFTPVGTSAALEKGEKLTYTLDLAVVGDGTWESDAGALRLVLLRSMRRISSDGLENDLSSGYMVAVNPRHPNIRFLSRDRVRSDQFSTWSNYTELSRGRAQRLAQNAAFTLVMEVERLENDDVQITYTATDENGSSASGSHVDSNYKFHDFDMIGFGHRPGKTGEIRINRIEVKKSR